jgi:hypothetical protein
MIFWEQEGNLSILRGRVLDIEDQSSRFGHHESHRTTVKGVIPV